MKDGTTIIKFILIGKSFSQWKLLRRGLSPQMTSVGSPYSAVQDLCFSLLCLSLLCFSPLPYEACAFLFCAFLHCAFLHCAFLNWTFLYCRTTHRPVLSTVLFFTVPFSNVLFSTATQGLCKALCFSPQCFSPPLSHKACAKHCVFLHCQTRGMCWALCFYCIVSTTAKCRHTVWPLATRCELHFRTLLCLTTLCNEDAKKGSEECNESQLGFPKAVNHQKLSFSRWSF